MLSTAKSPYFAFWTEGIHCGISFRVITDIHQVRLDNSASGYGDCHLWNLLSDGDTLTGIIDCNAMYGDFVIDIVMLKDAFPDQDVAGLFGNHYKERGIDIPYFNERLAGAHYFKGLDAMRF